MSHVPPSRTRRIATFALSVLLALSGLPASAIAEEIEAVTEAAETTELTAQASESDDLVVAEPQAADGIASGTLGTCSWRIDAQGALTIYPTNGTSGTFEFWYTTDVFDNYKNQVTSVTFAEGTHATKLIRMFEKFENLTTADLSKLDTSTCTTMEALFMDCHKLESVNLTGLDTSQVTAMDGLFARCYVLESVDLTGLNTSKVTSMYVMFGDCYALADLDVSHFDTSQVTDMCGMFDSCRSLTTLDVSNFNTSKVTRFRSMFEDCTSLTSVDISGMDMSAATSNDSCWEMFYGCSSLQTVTTDGTADLERVFPNGTGDITVVDTSDPGTQDPDPQKTSIATATVTGVAGWTYDATTHALAPTVTLGSTQLSQGSDFTLSGNTSARDAGSYTLTITGTGDYEGTLNCSYTVARKSVTVTADNKTKVAGEQDPPLTATVTGTCGGETVTYALSRAAGDVAGTYAITASGAAEQGSYAVTYAPGTFTVTTAQQGPQEGSLLDLLRAEYEAARSAAGQAIALIDAAQADLAQKETALGQATQDEADAQQAVTDATTAANQATSDLATATSQQQAAQTAKDNAQTDLGNAIDAYNQLASATEQQLQDQLTNAQNAYDQAVTDKTTADNEYTAAQQAHSQAQTDEAAAKSAWEGKVADYGTAQEAVEEAASHKTDVEYDKEYAEDSLNTAKTNLTNKQNAEAAAQTAKQAAEQAQAAAAADLAAKEAAFETAQYANSSVAFFTDKDSNTAAGYLTDTTSMEGVTQTTFASHTDLGLATDATSLQNMLDALDWIEYCNTLRAALSQDLLAKGLINEALPEFLITDELMASAQRNANFSTDSYGHALTSTNGLNMADYYGGRAAENLCRVPSTYGKEGAYKGWLTDEKALWENLIAQHPELAQYWLNKTGLTQAGYNANVGHYFALANPVYRYTGLGFTSNTNVTAVQQFRSEVETPSYTVAQYRARLLAYYNANNGAIAANYASASAAYDAALEVKTNADNDVTRKTTQLIVAQRAVQTAQNAVNAKQTAYDDAVAILNQATAQYNDAVTTANTKKAAADAAETVYNQKIAATQAAADTMAAKQAAVETAATNLATAATNLANAQAALTGDNPALAAAQQAMNAASATLEQAKANLKTANDNLAAKQTAYDNAQTALANAQTELANKQQAKADAQTAKNAAQQAVDTIRATYADQLEAYDVALAALNDATNLANAQITGIEDKTFSGAAQTQGAAHVSITITRGTRSETYDLVEGTDYTVSYAGNVSAGNARVTFTGTGAKDSGTFWGTRDATFSIAPASLAGARIANLVGWTYDGATHSVAPKVTLGGKTLVAGRDYTLEGASARNAGSYRVTVRGKGNYRDVATGTYTVAQRAVTVSANNASKTVGTADPRLTATVSGLVGLDKISYSVNRAAGELAGTYDIYATGAASQGNYRVTYKGAMFTINATPAPAPTSAAHVAYQTHVQKVGWQDWRRDGAMSGTSGRALRLEGINIKLEGAAYSGSIEYRTHVQTYGWQGYRRDGAMSGTSGEAKRLEAIQIRLTGQMAQHYDVWYRVHAQSYGWLGWAKNDSPAGTAGLAKRLEGIEIRVLPKGSAAPGEAFGAFVAKTGDSPAQSYAGHQVLYKTHVQSFGWQGWVADGQMSGTQGLAKRLEGIDIKLNEQPLSGGIEYRTHVQKIGWQGYVANGAMSGTSGRALRLEAIQIRLTGQMAQKYDVWYRVHAQRFGWMGWARNDQQSGTAGFAYRLEGIQILVLPKGSAAPGSTSDAFRQR